MNEIYVLDANVFVQASGSSIDVCPGYWKALSWHRKSGRVMSIDRVRDEIERGGDDLWNWVQTAYGQDGFQDGFASVGEPDVGRWFGEMAAWVQAKRSRIFFLKRGQSSPVRRSQMAGLPLMRNRAPRQW